MSINKIFSKKLLENCYLVALAIIVVMYLIRLSFGFGVLLDKFNMILRLSSYALIAFKIFIDFIKKEFTLKEIFIYITIGLFLLLISYQSKTIGYFVYYAFIIASKNVDYKKIIKVALWSHAVMLFLVFLSCKVGIIGDAIYAKGTRDRHSLGFGWCTTMSNMFMYVVLYYIYIRQDKMKIFEYILIFAINLYLYIMTDTKSAFGLTLFSLILCFMISYIKSLKKYTYAHKIFSIFLTIFLPVFIIFLTCIFDNNNIFLSKINGILSGRLYLGKMAFDTHGISLFARDIVFIGGEPEDMSIYTFVDSSFVQYLIHFGLIFFILMMVFLLRFAHRINKINDIYLLLCYTIFMIHSTFDPQLLLIEFNDFFLLF